MQHQDEQTSWLENATRGYWLSASVMRGRLLNGRHPEIRSKARETLRTLSRARGWPNLSRAARHLVQNEPIAGVDVGGGFVYCNETRHAHAEMARWSRTYRDWALSQGLNIPPSRSPPPGICGVTPDAIFVDDPGEPPEAC